MKQILSLCALMAFCQLPSVADGEVEVGQPYTLQVASQSVYLSNDGKLLKTAASLNEEPYYHTVYYFEESENADGTYYMKTPTGKYVWKQQEGSTDVTIGAKTQVAGAEELATPCAFTVQSSGENLLLRDVQTGLYLNMYVNSNGAALHSGNADASQWKIFRVEDNQSVTTVEEGVEYYLQTQRNATVGQYAYLTSNNTIQVAPTQSEASVFTFISNGSGAWYLHNVSGDVEVVQGSQGTLLKMERTTAQAEESVQAETFKLTQSNGGFTLQGATGSYLSFDTSAGTVTYGTTATTWNINSYDGEAPTLSTPLPDTYYNIIWAPTPTNYMSEEADGSLVVSSYDNTVRCFWEFIPTGKSRCYYIRNTATGRYIQSCSGAQSAQNTIDTGTEPVEYYVGENNGKFYLSSTDCSNYNTPSSNPNGLNKDGASSNIIAWGAQPSNSGSYWLLSETENLYEARPFTPSNTLGKTDYTYTLLSNAGLALQAKEDGTLSWEQKTEEGEQAWYFVGTSNVEGGYLIANVKNPTKTINLENEKLTVSESETPTRWCVYESNVDGMPYYFFRSATPDGEDGTDLSVDGTSLVQVRDIRSSFALSAQIYQMPCGALGSTYINKVSTDGEGVLVPLYYPLSTLSNGIITEESTKPSSWFTLFTHSKATFAAGSTFNLHLTLSAAPSDLDEVYVYFDWNRDGVFETTVKMDIAQTMNAAINVPADAKIGKSRMRVRLTNNGLSDPEDDAAGQIIDFIVNTEEAGAAYSVTAVPNDEMRGSVTLSPEGATQTAGTQVTATARQEGNSVFICWREGNNVLSADDTYTFTVDHNTNLVAYFSPNSNATLGIDEGLTNGQNVLVTITPGQKTINIETDAAIRRVLLYNANGQLLSQTSKKTIDTSNLSAGTYIVKVYTENSDASAKVLVK